MMEDDCSYFKMQKQDFNVGVYIYDSDGVWFSFEWVFRREKKERKRYSEWPSNSLPV